MDVEGLRNRIQSTLDPNAETRKQAELELKYVRYYNWLVLNFREASLTSDPKGRRSAWFY